MWRPSAKSVSETTPEIVLFHFDLVWSAIRNPQVSVHCNGLKVLMNAILEPNFSGIQESLLLAITYLLNDEPTRKFLRPTSDVAV